MRIIIIFVDFLFLLFIISVMKYQTKHKLEVITFLKKHQNEHLNISEISKGLKNVPTATLYRLIDSLVEEGLVRKYVIGPNQFCCFQYVECGEHLHFHLICEKCGKLIHLECHEVNHLIDHIKDDHGFDVDLSKVNLYGICEDCKKKEIICPGK